MLEKLRKTVCDANRTLNGSGLVTLTWGNVSGYDRRSRLVVIKPSGIAYGELTPESMVVINLEGQVSEGRLRPSSDAPAHIAVYRAFPQIRGVAHTHSTYATMFCQACRSIPCLGTTHADHFHGPVPVTRRLTPEETASGYESHTGNVIVETIGETDPLAIPAVLAASHGPFAWGRTPDEAVTNSVALECVARMAFGAILLNPDVAPLPRHLLDKHYRRKHGPEAYYGQDGAAGTSR